MDPKLPSKRPKPTGKNVVSLAPARDPKKLSVIVEAAIMLDMSVPLIADEYEKVFGEQIKHDDVRRILSEQYKNIAARRLALLEGQKLNLLASRSGRYTLLMAIYRSAANAVKYMKNGSRWQKESDPDRVTMTAVVQLAEKLARNQKEEDRNSEEFLGDDVVDVGQEIEDESGMGAEAWEVS